MSQKPSYFRIGLFVVVALAILAGGLIAFGAGQMFRPRILHRNVCRRHRARRGRRIAGEVPRRADRPRQFNKFYLQRIWRSEPGGSLQLRFHSDGDRP